MKFYLLLIQIFWCLLQQSASYIQSKEFDELLSSKLPYETKYFQTHVDYFTFKNESLKFNLKYLISTKHWSKGNAILFYCGNEANIEFFARNSGSLWELGEQLSAMVVFAEHRYYGASLPFGKKSFSSPEYFGYLTVEQVLADYAALLTYLKSKITGANKSPVIAFGGSYGGMLAAWFRLKYINIVAGSISSSAPFLMVGNYKNCNKIFQVMSKVYQSQGNKLCTENIRKIWPIIKAMNDTSGLKYLSKIFHLCQPLNDVETLINYLDDGLFEMNVNNFPYGASVKVPLPAWPVHKFCERFTNGNLSDIPNFLTSLYNAFQIYGNSSGNSKCLEFRAADETSPNSIAWEIQTCMELPFPMCRNGIHDIFFKENKTEGEFNNFCLKKYRIKPRSNWIKILLSGIHFQSVSNIIFSNGLLDPWSAGGIFESLNKKIQLIKIPNGAHHVDLRKSHPMDTIDIKMARKLEKKTIEKWISEWRE